jgi:uncharacterized protein (DUF362 family)
MHRVFVSMIRGDQEEILREALDYIGWDDIVKHDSRVFIKPNLTYPFYKPAVTTSPQVLGALLAILSTRTTNITIGESDGCCHAWKAEEAFEGHNLPDIAGRYGANLVNLSKMPLECSQTTVNNKTVRVELPSILFHDIDVFITVPVPKVHVMTGVSLGFKNQWGCIGNTMRIRHHPEFNWKIVAINKLLKPAIAVFDGTYFMNRMGPMDGDPVQKNLLIVSNDIGAGSLACCEIMGIDAYKIRHFQTALREGIFPISLDECELNRSLTPLKTHNFYLKRTLQNWAALWAFRHRFGTNLFYLLPFSSRPLHKILYFLKGKPKDFKSGY